MKRKHLGSGSRPSIFLSCVDPQETYGPQVIKKFLEQCHSSQSVLDLGAGSGRDLCIAKTVIPEAELFGLEIVEKYVAKLKSSGIKTFQCNLEAEQLPFADASLDIIIANQVMEHVKEIFWIMHEVTRVLKVGGHFIMGVPNVASMHNRLGLLLGRHPTQAKACSAHVRIYSKPDFIRFLKECSPGSYALKDFAGSQFYPFPPHLSRILCKIIPQNAFSIFFLLQKIKPYDNSFATYPQQAHLATNYKTM